MSSAIAEINKSNGLAVTMDNEVVLEEKRFELAQRKAKIYASSSLVPKEYQNNVGNVLIAENMARRMGADTLMVMQNLYVVHGKPGWSAQFLVACFNSCGRFSAIKYKFSGEPGASDYGCVAFCTELATGEVIEGTKITRAMADAEGWVNKSGSKWKTMPEQMFRYRAATFLIRSTAPEIGMGLLTKDEIEDAGPDMGNGVAQKTRDSQDALRQKLTAPVVETDDSVLGEIVETDAPEEPAEPMPEAEEQVVEPEDIGLDSATEELRDHATTMLNTFDQKRQKDLIAGRQPVAKMDAAELAAFIEYLEGLSE